MKPIVFRSYYNKIASILNKTTFTEQDLKKTAIKWSMNIQNKQFRFELPPDVRKTIILDFSRTKSTGAEITINPSFISGYTNIFGQYSFSDFTSQEASYLTNHHVATLQTHLGIGRLFIDNTLLYNKHRSPDIMNESLTLSSYHFSPIRRKFITYEVGNLFKTPLVGAGFTTEKMRRFSYNSGRTFNTIKFQLKKPRRIKFIINGNSFRQLDGYAGHYIIKNYPIYSGRNKIELQIIDKDTNKVIKSIKRIEYKTQQLKTFAEQELKYNIGYYSNIKNIKIITQLTEGSTISSLLYRGFHPSPVIDISHSVGIGSIFDMISNITLETQLKRHSNQTWSEIGLNFGTPDGLFQNKAHLNHHKLLGLGGALSTSYTKKRTKQNDSDSITLTIEARTGNYWDFEYNPAFTDFDTTKFAIDLSAHIVITKPFRFTTQLILLTEPFIKSMLIFHMSLKTVW